MSQDTKVAAALKDLPQRLQTPSLVARREIFQDLEALLNSNELQENIIKGLCKVVTITLLRYNDAKSRKLVLDFIKSCFSQHPVAVSKSLHAALLDVRIRNISIIPNLHYFSLLDSWRRPPPPSPCVSRVWQLLAGPAR